MAARNIKVIVGWVTTKMTKNLLRARKSGTSDCELRAETEAAEPSADKPRFPFLPPLLLLPSSSNLT